MSLSKQVAALRALDGRSVDIGWFSSAVYGPDEKRNRTGGEYVAATAAALDQGTSKMPARPFFRETYNEEAPNMRRLTVKMSQAVIAGKLTGDQLLDQLGLYMVGKVHEKILTQNFAPLSAQYLRYKMKFHSTPQILIDTKTLWRTLTYRKN